MNRLILLDRNQRDRRVIEVAMRAAGYLVTSFDEEELAWGAIQEDAFDLLIASHDPPALDAIAFCARTRAESKVARPLHLPTLLLLPNLTREGRLRAMEAGAADALAKPVSTPEILDRVSALCHRLSRDRLLGSSRPRPEDLTGDLAHVPAVDLLATFEAWSWSGILNLRTERGVPGTVYVRRGKPVDAEVGPVSGIPALSRIFSWHAGSYRIELKNIRRADVLGSSPVEVTLDGLDQGDTAGGRGAGSHGRPVHNPPDAASDTASDKLGDLHPDMSAADQPVPVLAVSSPQESSAHEIHEDDVLGEGSSLPSGVQSFEDRSSTVMASPGPESPGLASAGLASPELEAAKVVEPGPLHGQAESSLPAEAASGPVRLTPHEEKLALDPSAGEDRRPVSKNTLPLGLAGGGPGESVMPTASPPPTMLNALVGVEEAEPPARGSTWRALDESTREAEASTSVSAGASPTDISAHIPGDDGSSARGRDESSSSTGEKPWSDEDAIAELRLGGRGPGIRWAALAVALIAVAALGARRWVGGRHAHALPAARAGLAQPPGPVTTSRSEAPVPELHGPTPPAASASPVASKTDPAGQADAVRRPLGMPSSAVGSSPSPPSAPKPGEPSLVVGGTVAKSEEQSPRPRAPAPAGLVNPQRDEVASETVPAPPPGSPSSRKDGAASPLMECRESLARHLGSRTSIAPCERALSENPDSAEALTLLAEVEMRRGRMDRAQELASRAATLQPATAEAYAVLGGVLQDRGRDHEAKAAYEKYLSLAPHGRYAEELRSIVDTM